MWSLLRKVTRPRRSEVGIQRGHWLFKVAGIKQSLRFNGVEEVDAEEWEVDMQKESIPIAQCS